MNESGKSYWLHRLVLAFAIGALISALWSLVQVARPGALFARPGHDAIMLNYQWGDLKYGLGLMHSYLLLNPTDVKAIQCRSDAWDLARAGYEAWADGNLDMASDYYELARKALCCYFSNDTVEFWVEFWWSCPRPTPTPAPALPPLLTFPPYVMPY